MTSKTLTKQQALLIQRYVDGECDDDQRREARQLIEESSAARVYRSALESLGEAVRAAERQAWEEADVASSDEVVQLAESSEEYTEMGLEDLAPVLERYHDDEIDPWEAAIVEGLIEQREDVAEYLAELRRLGDGVRQATDVDDVDFDDFWEGVAAGIDEFEDADGDDSASPVAVEDFDPDEHARLLQRYHDGEATAEERRRVEAWLEAGNRQVHDRLEALDEVRHGVEAAVDEAVDSLDEDRLSDRVDEGLDTVDAEREADNVVGIDPRRDVEDDSSGAGWTRPFMAVAAAVALLATGALLGPQLFDQQPSEQADPVVIFEDVEPAPGSSFVIDSPEFADHDSQGDVDYEAAVRDEPVEPTIEAEDDEAEPTVLWVIDDEDDENDEDEDDEDEDEETDELPGPI